MKTNRVGKSTSNGQVAGARVFGSMVKCVLLMESKLRPYERLDPDRRSHGRRERPKNGSFSFEGHLPFGMSQE